MTEQVTPPLYTLPVAHDGTHRISLTVIPNAAHRRHDFLCSLMEAS